jgi:phosphonoacetaldehyde hydrolase
MPDAPRLKAVIFDWAGTVVDCGSRAPMGAFVRAFGQFGVTISIAEARGPMGMAKRDHIGLLTRHPRVADAWRAKHGHPATEAEIDAILGVFEPMNVASVRDHAELVPGAETGLAEIARRGLRIGSTTGYTRPIMNELEPIAAAAGYRPEITVCAGDLPEGRPSPLMMWYAMARMGVWPAASVVKVDDTPPGIGEGVNAGTWTVGVALTGNVAGLSTEELAALSDANRVAVREKGTAELKAAGADFVIDGIGDIAGVLDEIEARLGRGDGPGATRLPD